MIIDISTIDYIILLPMIFLAGFIDAIAGGGGLISLPAYWSVGIPPHVALGTNKFSSCFGTIFSTANYLRAGMIDIPVAVISAIMALFGSWLGAKTALIVSAQVLNYLLLIMIPLVTITTLLRKSIGYEDNAHLLNMHYRLFLALVVGLLIGFYDGFFGPGTGTFLILSFSILLHYDFVRANGNTKVVNLSSNLAAVVTFALAGKIYYPVAIPAAICGIVGNILGSKLVILRGNRLIKRVFVLALILLFIRVVYNILT